MTEDRAIELATEAAKAAGASPAAYFLPKARPHEGSWIVVFQEKAMQVGGHLLAVVDDESGNVELVAGA